MLANRDKSMMQLIRTGRCIQIFSIIYEYLLECVKLGQARYYTTDCVVLRSLKACSVVLRNYETTAPSRRP